RPRVHLHLPGLSRGPRAADGGAERDGGRRDLRGLPASSCRSVRPRAGSGAPGRAPPVGRAHLIAADPGPAGSAAGTPAQSDEVRPRTRRLAAAALSDLLLVLPL